MHVNTAEIKVLGVSQIRQLLDEQAATPARIESECKKALLFQMARNETEAAELLFWYAEAIGSNQLRQLEAAPYADRAVELAYQAPKPDYVLVAQARSLHLSFIATTLTRADFQHRANLLIREIEGFGQLTGEQQQQVMMCPTKLRQLGRNLTDNRAFTDM